VSSTGVYAQGPGRVRVRKISRPCDSDYRQSPVRAGEWPLRSGVPASVVALAGKSMARPYAADRRKVAQWVHVTAGARAVHNRIHRDMPRAAEHLLWKWKRMKLAGDPAIWVWMTSPRDVDVASWPVAAVGCGLSESGAPSGGWVASGQQCDGQGSGWQAASTGFVEAMRRCGRRLTAAAGPFARRWTERTWAV